MLWGIFIFRLCGNAVTDVLFGLRTKFGIQVWRAHGYTLGLKYWWKIDVVMVRSPFNLPQTDTEEEDSKLRSVLTSALRRVGGQRHATAVWPPERLGIRYTKGWVGSRARLNGRAEEKVTFPHQVLIKIENSVIF
jgi:hypothetical protein